MPSQTANAVLTYRGEEVNTSFLVEWDVEPPDPSVGIHFPHWHILNATVIDADVEPVTTELLKELQSIYDADPGKFERDLGESLATSYYDQKEEP